ncbi:MAG TPA: hypothetical protein VHC43_15520 [Mycobacteriales bacterium]|nr:hypothetical protein [Mycobacteriales bacterium]
MRASLATVGVLVAWSLLAFGNARDEGFYTSVGFTCVAVGFVVLVVVAASGAVLRIPSGAMLAVPLLTCLLMSILHPVGAYMYISGNGETAVKALVVVGAAAAIGTLLIRRIRNVWGLAAIAAIALATAIVVVRAAPSPAIDVWVFLQQSSTGLLHGANMYTQHWTGSPPGELSNVYPYLPGTTLLLAPFKWLLGDVRYGTAVAALAAVYLLWRLAPKAAPPLAALIVLMPHWAFLIDQSWTEPLLVVELAACILALRTGHTGWAVAALAAALVTKQFVAPLLPLFAIWRSFGVRRAAIAGAVAFGITLPWLIANPTAMWHDAVTTEINETVSPFADNLPAFLLRHGVHAGFAITLVVVGIAYAVAVARLPRTPSGLALGCALVMFALDIANKQTFFNHYTFPLGLLVIAIAAADAQESDDGTPIQAAPASVAA